MKENKELNNIASGLRATIEVYPKEIERYAAKEKDLHEFH